MSKWLLCAGFVVGACAPHAHGRALVAQAHAAPQPELAASQSWEMLAFTDGSTAEVRAEHPRAKLGQLGAMTLSISSSSSHFLATGLKDIAGDTSALASRAGEYDDTELTLDPVATRGSLVLFAITIEAHSGEDVQEGYLHTALWLFDSARVATTARRIWSGSGGEYHRYFEACAFVSQMRYELDASGTLRRRCKRVEERQANAGDYPDCKRGPAMTCANETLGDVNAMLH